MSISIRSLCALTSLAAASIAHAQFSRGNPFDNAKATYAPDRTFALQNLIVDLKVDYPNQVFEGTSTNTISPLRNGLKSIDLMAGENLDVLDVSVGGHSVPFGHVGRKLTVAIDGLQKGKILSVVTHYKYKKENRAVGNGAGRGGFHWIQPISGQPNHVGFWTQGETETNSNWAPTWDYPNDMTTTETRTTVPADWNVVGNGVLVSNTLVDGGKNRQYVWRLGIRHATYLLSLCAGPFDIKMSSWRGVPLWYVCPRGDGAYLEDSFGDTPDILSFYSDTFGYKYPWPKLAMDAMYDFGGGMENVSAITLPSNSLTDRHEGFHNMASLNAHEIGHEWFGDTVTCKDWGHIWLNESFATFVQSLYFEHSRGKNAYDREIEQNMQSYFAESRRYQRAIDTRNYPDGSVMFDSHTYPKGGVVLHTLRKWLGDENFFAGLKTYLNQWQHQPVEPGLLMRAMTDTSGINCEKFWDQWLYKPGHPVLDSTWTYDSAAKQVVMTVKQLQDTSKGAPIYDVPTHVGLISGGQLTREPVELNGATQEIRVGTPTKPDAVLLDPDHEFLRQIPDPHWSKSETPYIFQFAPNCIDRTKAFTMLMADSPSDDTIHMIVRTLQADSERFPAIGTTYALAALHREDLRPFFEGELKHLSFQRQTDAVRALADLPKTDAEVARMRSLVNADAPYSVVREALSALATWDLQGNMDEFLKAAKMPSHRETIRLAAYAALAKGGSAEGIASLVDAASPKNPMELRVGAIRAMGGVPASETKTRAAIAQALNEDNVQLLLAAVQAARDRKDKDLLPALQTAKDKQPTGRLSGALQTAIDEIKGSGA